MRYYKFVGWDIPPVDTVLGEKLPAALRAADNGDMQPLKDLHIATNEPVYKSMGWCFPYADYMRCFWVDTRDYGIIKVWALRKTDVRKAYKSQVVKIVEV